MSLPVPDGAAYDEALRFLHDRIDYERAAAADCTADDLRLDRLRRLLAELGDPHLAVPAIHVAGTKGKGSTAALLASVLRQAGYRTGLFVSPHLHALEERFTVDGRHARPAQVVSLVDRLREAVARIDAGSGRLPPTFFELVTALAWLHFARSRCDVVVLEVGLGGRLDATNLCRPEVCVVTNISRDHVRILGPTLADIAREKAGIVKPGVPVVTGIRQAETLAVLEDVCRTRGAPLRRLDREFTLRLDDREPTAPHVDPSENAPHSSCTPHSSTAPHRFDIVTARRTWSSLTVSLPGRHQTTNAALAVAVLDLLIERGWTIPESAVVDGLARTNWPARVEVLARNPTVVVDAAHNWASVGALVDTLPELGPARNRILVFASSRDKDYRGMLRRLLPHFPTVVLTRFRDNPRAIPLDQLQSAAAGLSSRPMHAASDPAAAWDLARRLAGPDDLVCAAGSFFLAAEFRELVLQEPPRD